MNRILDEVLKVLAKVYGVKVEDLMKAKRGKDNEAGRVGMDLINDIYTQRFRRGLEGLLQTPDLDAREMPAPPQLWNRAGLQLFLQFEILTRRLKVPIAEAGNASTSLSAIKSPALSPNTKSIFFGKLTDGTMRLGTIAMKSGKAGRSWHPTCI